MATSKQTDFWSFPAHRGEQIVSRFRECGAAGLGQFEDSTFFIKQRDGVVMGRGRFSGQPLYYLKRNMDEDVSSSLRALAGEEGARPDPEGVRDYLCYGFVPAPNTAIQGVGAVAPGTIISTLGGTTRVTKTFVPSAPNPVPIQDPKRVFWTSLCKTLERRDATAILLSGGLDSAMIAAAVRACGQKPTAVHLRFPRRPKRHDEETASARLVARHLGLRYEEVPVRATTALRSFERVVSLMDQPFADPVVLPFYSAFESGIADHDSFYTGEGGDQLFGSWSLRPMLVDACYSHEQGGRDHNYLISMHKFVPGWDRLINRDLLACLSDTRPNADPIRDAFSEASAADPIDQLRWVDIQLKAVQHILPRISAMAEGKSLRHPFFDPSMLRLSFTLPSQGKLDGVIDKMLLKQLGEAHLPVDIARRAKVGMGVPTRSWFRLGLRPLLWRYLSRRSVERIGVLDAKNVRMLLRNNLAPVDGRTGRWGDRLWMLCVLQAWFKSLGRNDFSWSV